MRHGLSFEPVHNIWCHIKGRCLNPNNHKYKDYGGRGIRVCDRWMKFDNFLQDMGIPPSGHSIERKDVNGDYTPENCIWLPIAKQAWNRRDTVWLTAGGETKALGQWCSELLIGEATIRARLRRGWDAERALLSPVLDRFEAAAVAHKAQKEKRKTSPRKYPVGDLAFAAKLTKQQVIDILQSDETNTALAKKYGVDRSTIYLARKGRNWGHVQDELKG